MPNMAGIINAIEEQGLRDQIKIIVGGAPITEEYAAQIGADGYAPDASQAVTLAKKLIS
jgi:5-methyltetrahydrofolate--homocysteine methyltransferase